MIKAVSQRSAVNGLGQLPVNVVIQTFSPFVFWKQRLQIIFAHNVSVCLYADLT